jgi:uncharacterized protein (DUF2252 family)
VPSRRDVHPSLDERARILESTRTRKMARSPHAYVRGNTAQFYEWLSSEGGQHLPDGPEVWICGDCHVGNLGPVVDAKGRIRIHIRDLDQTVPGNPSLDIVRLALSLASAIRGSNLPGVTTARMLEAVMGGYQSAFAHDFDQEEAEEEAPGAVQVVMKRASRRTWKQLAKERLDGTSPTIPLGKRFWPVSDEEREAIAHLFADPSISRLATMLKSREDDAQVAVIDSAYWLKGCSSLGLLRYAVLVSVTDNDTGSTDLCLMDVKEAISSAVPGPDSAHLLRDNAERVVEGARHISPFLGERMRATRLLDRSVFIRELLPQDLKLELETLTVDEATKAGRFLGGVVGFAHARQMDGQTRRNWQTELTTDRSKDLEAPSWLWSAVVGLLVSHEKTYLEHCRRFALANPAED